MLFDIYILKQIPEILSSLSKVVVKNRSTQKLLLDELKRNLKQFENATKIGFNHEQLIQVLSNNEITKANENGFVFSLVKLGRIQNKHIKDKRNARYKGKDCEWLFSSISNKIEELKSLNSAKRLDAITELNIKLQFSNLFFKMKLIAEFIK